MKYICKHEWGQWRTLYYPDTFPAIGYAAIRTCKGCGWREFNDWTRDRIGTDMKLLPPEIETITPAPVKRGKRK